MKLIPDAKFVATRSHSIIACTLGLLCFNLPDAIYLGTGIDTNPAMWSVIGNILFVYAILGRLIRQDHDAPPWRAPLAVLVLIAAVVFLMGMGRWVDDTGGREPPGIEAVTGPPSDAEVLAWAVPLVAKWEGLRTTAYLDTLAEPDVWTICYGETQGVQPGETRTEAECEAGLRRELPRYGHGWYEALTETTLNHRLPATRAAAFWSFAWNVGVSGAKGSTATRRLNAGDVRGACEAMGWWNKAGGRVVRGLVNRRGEETALCLRGA